MTDAAPAGRMRLQKFLSDAGVASRRHAEEMILEGHVLVNDQIVTELPAFVDPEHDVVIVDGDLVRVQPPIYFIVHKPPGVVCTNYDPAGRTRAVDLLPPLKQKLFPVGRLDEDSSGLLLMTNDGELAERIAHPRFGIPKVYRAEVRGRVPTDLREQMKRGIHLSDGLARAAEVDVVRVSNEGSILHITLREGRNRQVRRMLARLGFPVRKLKRLEIGPLSLKGLPLGGARRLAADEIRALRASLAATPAPRPRRMGRGPRSGGPGSAPPRGRGTPTSKKSPRRPSPEGRRKRPPEGPGRRVVS